MNIQELDKLLEKYYRGESTDQEDQLLRIFFSGNEIPEGYEAEKAIFQYFIKDADIPEPSRDFEERMGRIAEKGPGVKLRSRLLIYSGIAAGLALLVSLWFFSDRSGTGDDTFSDPAIAYAETMRVLYHVSAELNKGAMALEPISRMNEAASGLKPLAKPARQVEDNLKSLNHLERAFELVKEPSEK